MRHAESEPASARVRDHDREITPLGAQETREVHTLATLLLRSPCGRGSERALLLAAPKPSTSRPRTPLQVGEQLRATGWLPQVVICSNAQRTRQTLDVLQRVLPGLGAGALTLRLASCSSARLLAAALGWQPRCPPAFVPAVPGVRRCPCRAGQLCTPGTPELLRDAAATLSALPAGDADQHFLGSLYTTAALDGQTRGHLTELVCAEATADHDCCLCLGHNKGWQEAASSFAVSWPRRRGMSGCAALLLPLLTRCAAWRPRCSVRRVGKCS